MLDGNKIRPLYLPDTVLGQLYYKGTFDATKTQTTTKQRGDYWICSTAGTKNPDGTTANSSFAVGDWAVYNGTSWDKIDNTDAVTMVNGQIGSVKTYKGAYASATKYYQGDIVLANSCLYLFINATATAGKAVTEVDYWKIFGKVYGTATTTDDGLMSKTDKTNLDANTGARHSHSNKALLDTYKQTEANLADAVSKKHSHSNKTILDNTTASFTTAKETKLSNINDELLNKTVNQIAPVRSVNGQTGAVKTYKGEYIATATYYYGDMVRYNDLLYVDVWNTTGGITGKEPSVATYSTGTNTIDYVWKPLGSVASVNGETGNVQTYKGQFDDKKVYHSGGIVLYNSVLYICTTETAQQTTCDQSYNPSGYKTLPPDNSVSWTALNSKSYKGDYTDNKAYFAGDIVKYDDKIYLCKNETNYVLYTDISQTTPTSTMVYVNPKNEFVYNTHTTTYTFAVWVQIDNQVNDVKVNGTSVLDANGVANISLKGKYETIETTDTRWVAQTLNGKTYQAIKLDSDDTVLNVFRASDKQEIVVQKIYNNGLYLLVGTAKIKCIVRKW